MGGGRWGLRALAGDKHGLISDSCRNQNIISSCILMSWLLQRRSVHALIYSIFLCIHPVYLITRTVHINQHLSHLHISANIPVRASPLSPHTLCPPACLAGPCHCFLGTKSQATLSRCYLFFLLIASADMQIRTKALSITRRADNIVVVQI